jgi:exodeoxyribonuclease V alpha subunit
VGSGIARVSRAVNSGEGEAALERIKSGRHEDISWRPLPDPQDLGRALRQILLEGYRPCLEATDTHEMFHAYDRFRLLCALRKGPYGAAALNRLAEQILRREGLIPAEGRWYPGRPVLITRNDYTLDLFNGDMGIVLPDPSAGGEPRVFFRTPEGSLRGFLPFRLPEHETAYAMTVHKSQGSEFDGALLILSDRPSPVLTRELIYTGVTRARHRVEVWGRDEVFLEGVSHRTVRASGLRDALWGEGP